MGTRGLEFQCCTECNNRLSTPILANLSFLRLLRSTLEYLRYPHLSEIWDNAIMRGHNIQVEAKSLSSNSGSPETPCSVLSLNKPGLSIHVISRTPRLPSLELTHPLPDVEGTHRN